MCHNIYRHQASLASCVMCGVKRGHLEVLRTLTADLRVPLDIRNKQGLSPLQTTEDQTIIELLRTEYKRYYSFSFIGENERFLTQLKRGPL